MKRGEIWWVDFNPSVGGEIRKTRPAIILSNDAANKHLNRVLVVPVTSNIKRVYPGEVLVNIGEKVGKAMASQLTTASKKRLLRKMGTLSPDEMRLVEIAVKVQLGLTP